MSAKLVNRTISPSSVDSSSNIDNNEQIYNSRERIETLFLYQRFENVIIECLKLLLQQQQQESVNIDSNDINQLLLSLNDVKHKCNITDETPQCQCQWIMELLIQSLYEINKPSDALKLVNRYYYNGLLYSPFSIFTLCIHLLVYMKSYHEAKDLILNYLNKSVESSSSLKNDSSQKQVEHDQLVELLVFHIMFRIPSIDEARQFLKTNVHLSDWKREGFIKSLEEMVQIKEIEEKNHREQTLLKQQLLQQQQQHQLQEQLNQQQLHQQQQLQQQQQQQTTLNKDDSDNIINQNKSNNSNLLNRIISLLKQFSIRRLVYNIKRRIIFIYLALKKGLTLQLSTGNIIGWLKSHAPLVIWSTIILISLRHLYLSSRSAKVNNQSMISGHSNNYQQQGRMVVPPRPNISSSSSSVYQPQPQQQTMQRKRLGASSNQFNQNQFNNNNSNNSGVLKSMKDLVSTAFSFKFS